MAVTSSRAGHRSPETPAAGSPRRHLPGSFAGERRPRLSLFPPESIFPPKSFKWPRKCRRPSSGCPHGAVTTGQCPASRVRSQPRFLPVGTDHVSSFLRSRRRHVPEGDGPWLFRCTITRCCRTGGKGLCEAHVCRPALGPTCALAMCHGRWPLLGGGPRKPGPQSRASDPCAGPRVWSCFCFPDLVRWPPPSTPPAGPGGRSLLCPQDRAGDSDGESRRKSRTFAGRTQAAGRHQRPPFRGDV